MLSKEADKAHYEDDEDDRGDDPGDVAAHPRSDLEAAAFVCFADEIVPAEAVFACAEQHEDHRAQRQQAVGDEDGWKPDQRL